MSHTESTEQHLKPASTQGEIIRNKIGELITSHVDFTVEGLKNVKNLKDGAIIVVAPHNGHLDTIFVRMAFDEEFRKLMFAIAAGDYWERIGWKQLANAIARTFLISRNNIKQSVRDLAQIAQLVKKGERAILFLEGTRSRNPQELMNKREFKPGFGLLALMTEGKIPVIPIYLEGNESLLPPGKKLPQFKKGKKPIKVTVKIGDPINLSKYAKKPYVEMTRGEITEKRKIITGLIYEYFLIQEMIEDDHEK